MMEGQERNSFLMQHSSSEWKEIVALKQSIIPFKKGSNIFSKGEKVKGIFFIHTGAVKVHKQWNEEKELIVRFAKGGEVLGHRGFGKEDTYPVTATALEDGEAGFITTDFRNATIKYNPEFTYRLIRFYTDELHFAENRMYDLTHKDVNTRIAESLLYIQNFFGKAKDGFIALTLTRQDIAAFAGTRYETVFKFFTQLTDQKIILTEGKRINIVDEKRLREMI